MLKYSIRPHHLLCMCFFEGKGYSKEFTKNMQYIIDNLKLTTKITLSDNTDCICQKCPYNLSGKCKSFEKVKNYDEAVLKMCLLKTNTEYSFEFLNKVVKNEIIEKNDLQSVCRDCQWYSVCSNKK